MKGEPILYRDFMIFPEDCDLTLDELSRIYADESINYTIGSLPMRDMNMVMVFHTGEAVYKRGKYRLHSTEKDLKVGTPPEPIKLGNKSVLVLICYELMFPEDYLKTNWGTIDFIVHLVGEPMCNIEQKEAWVALQRAVSLWYECPVVCCCGGKPGPMNITGVTNV